MKRLLVAWMTGNMACLGWSKSEIQAMTDHMSVLRTPREINRDARSFKVFSMWKGQEFRNFLCYYGPVVLVERLPLRYYDHFLKLFCAVRHAYSEKYARQIPLIERLFVDYVKDFKNIYGAQFMTSNVHNLLHVHEDIKRILIFSTTLKFSP